MSGLLALLTLVALVLPSTLSAGCTHTVAEGTDKYVLPLYGAKLSDTFELEWKHNSAHIFKRKSNTIRPGKKEDIDEEGGLVLRRLADEHAGAYVGEVFDKGVSLTKKEIELCVKARVPKPTVTFRCPTKASPSPEVTLSCSLTQQPDPDMTFAWRKNKVIMDGEKKPTLVMKIKVLKRDDTFGCTVDDTYSHETSESVKSTCKDIQEQGTSGSLLFGFPFWVTVSVLSGGGGFVLLLIVITAVCCYRNHCRSQEDDEAEFRLAPLTQPQPQPGHKDPAHRHKPPMEATRPLPSAGAPREPSAQPRAQARVRPAPPPQDKDEDGRPPLPHPRRSGPRPPLH